MKVVWYELKVTHFLVQDDVYYICCEFVFVFE